MEFDGAQMQEELEDGDPGLQSPAAKKPQNYADDMNAIQEQEENQKIELLTPAHRDLNFNSEYKDKDNN